MSYTDVLGRASTLQAQIVALEEQHKKTPLCALEQGKLQAHRDELSFLQTQVRAHQSRYGFFDRATGLRVSRPGPSMGDDFEDSPEQPANRGINLTSPEARATIEALGNYYQTGVSASDVPLQIVESPVNSGASASIPVEVANLIVNLNDVDPFLGAGARQITRNSTGPMVIPITYAAVAASVKNEGQMETDSTPPGLTSWTIEGDKYNNLTKVSLEALMNVAFDLGQTVSRALLVGQIQSQVADISDALQAALQGNSDCFVSNGSDSYEALVNLITSISPTFSGPGNRFMLSRADLAVLLNVRGGASTMPILDPTSRTLLGFPYVINDNLSRVVFGDFQSGVLVARTPLYVQRLQELYAAAGMVGFSGIQWCDKKFYADLTPTDQPLRFVSLSTEGS